MEGETAVKRNVGSEESPGGKWSQDVRDTFAGTKLRRDG